MKYPEMTIGEFGWLESRRVLGWYSHGWEIVKIEQMDDDCLPAWRSCCSERWEVKEPMAWQELPPEPII